MAAFTSTRLTPTAGLTPSKGTYGIAANTLCLKGAIAVVNSDGNVYMGIDDNAACPAVGIFASEYDNRTTAPSGGGAAAIDAEIEFGVFGLRYTGTAPKAGQVVFVVDNQTVSIDSDSGTRGIGGYVTELRDGLAWVKMDPTVAGQIVIAAAEAADLDTAQTDIDALQADALSANAVIPVPLTSFLDADCDPLAKFVSADNPTLGFNLADSEAVCLRWNNHATPGTATCQVGLPPDLDDTAPITIEFLASKSGATVGDATTLTLAAYLIAAGNLHDADTAVAATTGALVGNATAKTTAVLTATIAHGDVPANARSMTFTVTPTAGTLGTDDLLIHDVLVRYTRKLRTA